MDDRYQRLVQARKDRDLPTVEAIAQELLTEHPNDVSALEELAIALGEAGRHGEAREALEEACTVDPRNAGLRMMLGVTCGACLDPDAAGVHLRAAHLLAPTAPRVNWNYALWLLQNGHWREGFSLYRWGVPGSMRRARTLAPAWDGRQCEVLHVWGEQGYGDVVMYSQFLDLAKRRSQAWLVLECPERLCPLMRSCPGVDEVVPYYQDGSLHPGADAHVGLMDLPHALQCAPRGEPWMSVDADETRAARVLLESLAGPGPWVALAWAGNKEFVNDAERSVHDVKVLEPVLGAGVNLVSFQVGQHEEALDGRVPSVRAHLTDWRATAALLSACDGLVTTSTGILHVAGAMGLPVHAMLDCRPDWRYGRWKSAQCAFHRYPGFTMHWQARPGDWLSVTESVARAIRRGAGEAQADRRASDK